MQCEITHQQEPLLAWAPFAAMCEIEISGESDAARMARTVLNSGDMVRSITSLARIARRSYARRLGPSTNTAAADAAVANTSFDHVPGESHTDLRERQQCARCPPAPAHASRQGFRRPSAPSLAQTSVPPTASSVNADTRQRRSVYPRGIRVRRPGASGADSSDHWVELEREIMFATDMTGVDRDVETGLAGSADAHQAELQAVFHQLISEALQGSGVHVLTTGGGVMRVGGELAGGGLPRPVTRSTRRPLPNHVLSQLPVFTFTNADRDAYMAQFGSTADCPVLHAPLEPGVRAMRLPCGHIGDASALSLVFESSNVCPACGLNPADILINGRAQQPSDVSRFVPPSLRTERNSAEDDDDGGDGDGDDGDDDDGDGDDGDGDDGDGDEDGNGDGDGDGDDDIDGQGDGEAKDNVDGDGDDDGCNLDIRDDIRDDEYVDTNAIHTSVEYNDAVEHNSDNLISPSVAEQLPSSHVSTSRPEPPHSVVPVDDEPAAPTLAEAREQVLDQDNDKERDAALADEAARGASGADTINLDCEMRASDAVDDVDVSARAETFAHAAGIASLLSDGAGVNEPWQSVIIHERDDTGRCTEPSPTQIVDAVAEHAAGTSGNADSGQPCSERREQVQRSMEGALASGDDALSESVAASSTYHRSSTTRSIEEAAEDSREHPRRQRRTRNESDEEGVQRTRTSSRRSRSVRKERGSAEDQSHTRRSTRRRR